MKYNYFFFVALVIFSLTSCSNSELDKSVGTTKILNPTNKVRLAREIKWEALNPARGDASPKAGTVWGDRKSKVATGFLAKFVDGFSSPPHIHNVTYRAMVIEGLVHNDDPKAENMWMPPGSFWTQPAGEAHITSAKGPSIAYVEIDSGPYLVKPTDEAFDKGEQPINISKENMIWLDAAQLKQIENNNASMAFLWETKEFTGNAVKLTNGFKGNILSDGDIFHAVIIEGELKYKVPESDEWKVLYPGAYFGAESKALHEISSDGCTVYIRTNGDIKIN